MNVSLTKLNYTFINKPLLVGGMAMEFYGLRKSGRDIDFLADEKDVLELIKIYPNKVKDLWGDLGVCPYEFEIWKTIGYYNYFDLKVNAVDLGEYLVASEENLLFMKTLAMKNKKYFKDTELLIEYILKRKFKQYEKMVSRNKKLLQGIENITYLERKGRSEI